MNQSVHQMQRYVVGGVVLLSAMAVSFPIAMARVSQTSQFPGQAVKSEDCASQPLKEAKVVTWAKDCAPLKVAPLPKPPVPAGVSSSPSPETPAPNATKTELAALRLGMSGPAVIALQEKLQNAGGFDGAIDGIFGQETEIAVQAMQQKLKLEPDGVANASFQAAIDRR